MENFVWSVCWKTSLRIHHQLKRHRLIYDLVFQNFLNQLLSSSLFLFSVYRFILLRRIAICDVATLMTTRKSSHLWITAKPGASCFCFENNNKQNTPNVTVLRQAEDDIICLTTACTSIGNTILSHALPIYTSKNCNIFCINHTFYRKLVVVFSLNDSIKVFINRRNEQ